MYPINQTGPCSNRISYLDILSFLDPAAGDRIGRKLAGASDGGCPMVDERRGNICILDFLVDMRRGNICNLDFLVDESGGNICILDFLVGEGEGIFVSWIS